MTEGQPREGLDAATLRAALENIKDHPELWSQEDWINPCHTAFCYAGHIAVQLGVEIPAKWQPWYVDPATGHLDSEGTHVSNYARDKAGLTEWEELLLFSGANTLDDLEAYVSALEQGTDLKGKRHRNGQWEEKQ